MYSVVHCPDPTVLKDNVVCTLSGINERKANEVKVAVGISDIEKVKKLCNGDLLISEVAGLEAINQKKPKILQIIINLW